jgi:hypothetical protein
MESKFLVKSLGSNSISFVKIDNFPSLVGTTMSLMHVDISGFFIFVSINIKYLVGLNIGDELTFKDEQLPPA